MAKADSVTVFAALGVPNVVIAAGAALLIAVVARKRVFGSNERTSTSWLDAWLKAIVMVVFAVFFTIYLPSYVIQTSTVSGMDRIVQDLIGSAVWGAGIVAAMWGLWYAHREKRV